MSDAGPTGSRPTASHFKADLRLYRKLAQRFRPYWSYILGLFALSLLSVPLKLLAPVPLKIAVDNVIGSAALSPWLQAIIPAPIAASRTGLLATAAAFIVAVAILTQLLDLITAWVRTFVSEKLVVGLRTELFGHAHRLSLSYHDTKGSADTIYRIQNDAGAIQSIAVDGIIPLLTSALTLLSLIYVTTRISWRLAVVALAILPLLLLVSQMYRPKLRTAWREVKQLETLALSVIHEVLGALRVVKAFGQGEREEQRFARRATDGMRARLRVGLVERQYGLLVALVTAIGTALVLYVGVGEVLSGRLTLGDLLLVMSYLTQLYEPLKTISKRAGAMQSHLASVDRAFALLDEPHDVLERPHPRPLRRAQGGICFEDVSFSYGGDRTVLEHVTFDMRPGQRVGIIGATGAGKTTILSLMARLYDPSNGRVLLDGVDVRDYKLADLRNQFSIVLQEPVLFSTSITENISYARPGATLEDISAAAKAASIHDFIVSLPDGYDTVVGERGFRLSGGERQRVSLARAFLRDAPILILDEPTSSVDMNTEASIVEILQRLFRGRTTIIITHRPSLLNGCDTVFRVSDKTVGDLGPIGDPTEATVLPVYRAAGVSR
jgi:ATP-binding cassette subfamily B protein